jgi:subtilisin family serine protease
MAEILSFNSPNGSGSVKKGNFLKSFWNWFSSQDKSLKLSIATILFVALATPFIVNNLLETRQRAQEPQSAIGQEKDPQFISNELLVKIKKETKGRVKEGKPDDTGIPSLDNINRKFQAKGFERVAKLGKKSKSDSDVFAWYKITLPGEKEIISGKLDKTEVTLENNYSDAPAIEKLKLLIADLKRDANIEAIEPNYIFSSAATPNDPYYSSSGSWGQSYQDLWGMHKINAASSWDQSTGSTNIVVADIDSGVDRNHEDLQGQMWVNTGETPGNSQDDDGNGYVDDYHGWDWVNNDNDPMDDYGHGTHTAGSIAAVGNNAKGAVGVNWISKIMSLKYLNSSGNGTLANSLSALVYAADNGARISSNSWNCWYCTNINANAIDDAVKYEHEAGMVIVVAAGNDNSDALNHMPASSQYSIAVSASDHTDARWEYSSWGEKVDVAAPGNEILSLKSSVSPMCPSSVTVGVNYCRRSGTSMAAPHVSGLAALLLAKNPALTNEQVRQIIRNGADDTGTPGKDNDFGYGRINAANSMGLANTVPHTPFINSPRSRTALNGIVQIIGSVPGPNFQKYIVEVGSGRSPTSWTTLADSTNQVINGVLATLDSTTRPNGFNIIRVTSLDNNNKPYQFAVHDLVVDNIVSSLDSPNFVAISNSVSITGSAYTLNNVPFANYILEWGVGDEPMSWSSSGIRSALPLTHLWDRKFSLLACSLIRICYRLFQRYFREVL